MTRTEIERLTVIETKFETIIEPMAFKVDQIHDQLPEIVRKVNSHHTVFHDHSELLEKLEAAQCPVAKVMPDKRLSDGNGGYIERRTKKSWRQQFKEMTLAKKISSLVVVITFFAAFGEWLLGKGHSILYLLESMFK